MSERLTDGALEQIAKAPSYKLVGPWGAVDVRDMAAELRSLRASSTLTGADVNALQVVRDEVLEFGLAADEDRQTGGSYRREALAVLDRLLAAAEVKS